MRTYEYVSTHTRVCVCVGARAWQRARVYAYSHVNAHAREAQLHIHEPAVSFPLARPFRILRAPPRQAPGRPIPFQGEEL